MTADFVDEYSDAERYDAEYGGYACDFDFFLDLLDVFRTHPCDILDLGCGTGRLTFKLAENGHHLTGLDGSVEMLARAQEKDGRGRIQWVHGDLRAFGLGKTFDLITMTGNTFQALLSDDDQQIMLDCVKKHMKPGSLFAFNTRNPSLEHIYNTSKFEHWHTFKDGENHAVKVSGRQSYNPQTYIMTYETKRQWSNHETLSFLHIRFTPYDALMTLLKSCGFTILNTYSAWDKSPFTEDSPSMICVCFVV
ncbi:MAG: class I SAM-dependent methyltransferase [Alphaproteobacteria bacterium]|nr:class I SAM-dependent methyltransferase [Alphaproteobacteria bacterium]